MSKIWKTMSGKLVEDHLAEVTKSIVAGNKVLHVGCDSQQHALKTDFVSVIVLLKPGKGGRALWTRDSVPRIHSLRQRLLNEVQRSVVLAFELLEIISDDIELNVHIDVNQDLRFKSSKFLQELEGYVTGQGLTVLTKPDSWVAMHVADHIVKHKNDRYCN